MAWGSVPLGPTLGQSHRTEANLGCWKAEPPPNPLSFWAHGPPGVRQWKEGLPLPYPPMPCSSGETRATPGGHFFSAL